MPLICNIILQRSPPQVWPAIWQCHCGPKGLWPKQNILSLPILSFTKYLLSACYVPVIVLAGELWQWAKQMCFQPSKNLQTDREADIK